MTQLKILQIFKKLLRRSWRYIFDFLAKWISRKIKIFHEKISFLDANKFVNLAEAIFLISVNVMFKFFQGGVAMT